MDASSFRTSWTQQEGLRPSHILECRIVDINMVNWTVDCVSVFDQRRYFGIQVASPYMHYNTGEGIYVMPDVGAKCYVCIPSDGPPPFVLAFLMPSETLPNTSTEDAPAGTDGQRGKELAAAGSTFAGGRLKAKPGDIVLRGHDGNFVVLHRGGVLQIGATALAQRLYIPLSNLITDVSQNYNHFNTGGSVNWGIRPGSPEEKPETEYRETFRVWANDQYADVRLCVGKVHTPIPEPAGDKGCQSDLDQLQINKQIYVEFVLAPQGFDTTTGTPSNANVKDNTKVRFFFDEEGSAMLRCEGAVVMRTKKDLWITSDKTLKLHGKENVIIESGPNSASIRISGDKSMELGTNGGVIKLNGGSKPVATVGSMVNVTVTVPIPIVTSAGPGTISAGAVLIGQISTGNPTILA